MVRRERIPPALLPTDIHFLIPNTTIRRCFIKCWGVRVKLKQMSPQGLLLQSSISGEDYSPGFV